MNELDLLENEIEGDWSNIREKFKEKLKKEKKEKRIHPRIPSFKEFIKLMYEIYSSGNDFLSNIAGYFLAEEKKIPESFSNIWDIYSGRKYCRIVKFDCKECNGEFDIIFQDFVFTQEDYISSAIRACVIKKIDRDICFCPNCGRNSFYVTGKVIGIFNRRGVYDA